MANWLRFSSSRISEFRRIHEPLDRSPESLVQSDFGSPAEEAGGFGGV